MGSTTMRNRAQVQAGSGLNIIAGIRMIIAPFALAYSDSAMALANDISVGAAVLVLAMVRSMGAFRMRWAWISVTNALIGGWLIAAPFVLGYSNIEAAVWNDVALGILIALFALWSAALSPVRPTRR